MTDLDITEDTPWHVVFGMAENPLQHDRLKAHVDVALQGSFGDSDLAELRNAIAALPAMTEAGIQHFLQDVDDMDARDRFLRIVNRAQEALGRECVAALEFIDQLSLAASDRTGLEIAQQEVSVTPS